MDVTRIRALRGPNLWSRHLAIEAVVSCTAQECTMSRIDGFEARLRALFPAIGVLQPQGGETDLSLAHVLQAAALALQAQAGCPVSFARTTPTVDAGVFLVVVEYTEEEPWAARPSSTPGNWYRRPSMATPSTPKPPFPTCVIWTKTCAWAPARGPSSRPPWPGASPTADSPRAVWCSWAGAPSSGASRRPRSIPPAPWPNPSARTRT
jgi:hypothetical protein